ncbi:MAG: WD40 repeat domain-containing serine/threonine protein kinase [Verrucomicrobia bacterium]|nr:WD40 repeat domain-containing serine/threonine protein kinase [Verrucomicrobiota bacterium]
MDQPLSLCPACSLSFDPLASHGQCPRCALSGALYSAAPAGRTDLRVGGRLAQFELVDEIGRGAMGRVWLARDTQLDRLVALKTLPADPGSGRLLEARLEREARTAAGLRHPSIVAVHGFGRVDDTVWLAMEFAEGGDLRTRLRDQPMSAPAVAQMGAKLARALAAAHDAGVLHRDLKPSNILLDEHGEPKLGDFGLAAPAAGVGDLTLTGQLLGTPSYLAPEGLVPHRGPLTAASDVYSLGAVLYEMLVGRPPFVGDSPAAILAAVTGRDPVSPSQIRPGLPRDLETIVLKALEKEPAARYASARALAEDLEAFAQGRPIAARPVSAAGRFMRWARREPALAGTAAAAVLLLVTVAVVSTAAAVRIGRAKTAADASAVRATAEAARATRAEAATRTELRSALLAQASATRLTGRTGQRDLTLATLRQAAQIRPGLDLRNEAIIALTLPELRLARDELPVRTSPDQMLAFDPMHDRAATEVAPGRWEVRSLADKKILGTFTAATGPARSRAVFSEDGQYFAVRGAADVVAVWRLDTPGAPAFVLPGRPFFAKTLERGFGQPDAFSPDGKRFVSSLGADGGFTIHELPSGRELRRVATPGPLTHLVFSRDGRQLAAGRGLRGPAGIYLALTDGEARADLRVLAHNDPFQTLDWSPEGARLFGGTITWNVIDTASGRTLTSVRDGEAAYGYFGPDGQTAITVGKSGSLRLWDLRSGDTLLRAALGGGPEFAVSRDRAHFLKNRGPAAAGEFALALPSAARFLPPAAAFVDNAPRNGAMLRYSPDGRWLAQCVDGALHLRDAASGRLVRSQKLGGPSDQVSAIWLPDGSGLYVGSTKEGLLKFPFTDAPTAAFGPPTVLDAEPGYIVADLDPAAAHVVMLGGDAGGQAKVVPLAGDGATVRWKFPTPTCAAFCDGGRTVVVNGVSGLGRLPLELFDAATGASVRSLGLQQGYEVSRSRDGAWVALGTGPQSTVLRRTADWSAGPALPPALQGAFKSTAFSPDSTVVAIAAGAQINLVRLADGAVLAALEAAQSGTYVSDLTFSPDGQRLAVLWRYGQVTLWDLTAVHRDLQELGLDW